jgi:hypothetical protein
MNNKYTLRRKSILSNGVTIENTLDFKGNSEWRKETVEWPSGTKDVYTVKPDEQYAEYLRLKAIYEPS